MPWLISRRLTLFSSFLDSILAFIFFSKIDTIYFSYGSYYLWIAISASWIFISYILGRYSRQENSYSIIFLRNSLSIIITIGLCSIFFSLCSLVLIYLIGYIKFDSLYSIYKLFLTFSICSYIIQTIINLLTKKLFTGKNTWVFLGDEDFYFKFEQYINCSRVEVKLKKLAIQDLNLNSLSRVSGIVLEDLDLLPNRNFETLLSLKSKGIKILSIFEWCEMILQRYPSKLINSEALITRSFTSKKKSVELRLKRIAELLISFLLIVLTFPLIFIAAILIKFEDNGSIFYSHIRTGYAGNPFKIYKLRTMRIDAEKQGAQWAQKNDSRVTKIGSFLRATRIDELPQLLSVIKGEMSLIGPRPERPEIEETLEKKISNYRLRHLMRPGISGWAQVNYPYGASIEDTENKLSYDLYYLRNFSTFLDILILFKTIKIVFRASGSIPNKSMKRLK